MFLVVAATAWSPARSCTRGASPRSNGRRISRSVSSVGRFFGNDVSKTHLSFMDYTGVQAPKPQLEAFGRVCEITHGLPIAALKFDAPCVWVIRDLNYRLTDVHPRTCGKVGFMQVEI